jgi:hypothetical protein
MNEDQSVSPDISKRTVVDRARAMREVGDRWLVACVKLASHLECAVGGTPDQWITFARDGGPMPVPLKPSEKMVETIARAEEDAKRAEEQGLCVGGWCEWDQTGDIWRGEIIEDCGDRWRIRYPNGRIARHLKSACRPVSSTADPQCLLAENGGKILDYAVRLPNDVADKLDIAKTALRIAALQVANEGNCPPGPNNHPHCDSAHVAICGECWYAEFIRLARKECATDMKPRFNIGDFVKLVAYPMFGRVTHQERNEDTGVWDYWLAATGDKMCPIRVRWPGYELEEMEDGG